MAYLRGKTYIWASSDMVHFWSRGEGKDYVDNWVRDCDFDSGVALPHKDVDAFVAMRWAEMSKKRRKKALGETAK